MSIAERRQGKLDIVGLGMQTPSQCTPEALARIVDADIVYALAGSGFAADWLARQNPRLRSLVHLYAAAGNRRETYSAVVAELMGAVRAGLKVCAVFYGHPGVFVTPSHEALAIARAEGFQAAMFPAISAQDCLYADLSVDPGIGVQSYEARDFFVHARAIDVSAALILWQVAVMDDQSLQRLTAGPRTLALLSEVLGEFYPARHEVVIYEAATLVIAKPVIQRLPLARLPHARITQASTLYAPPLHAPRPAPDRLARLAAPQS